TLRLMAATPRRWLADGQVVRCQAAPTAFGPVSCTLTSQLSAGHVIAEVDLPALADREPASKILLRARVPDGYRCTQARCADEELALDEQGSVDLSGRRGHVKVVFAVEKR
ncbi:MAG: hypothetical protein ACTHK7_18725, partial [Aureliella sp.]